jgi:hypothetical protein
MANKVKLVSSTQIYRDTRTLMNHIIDVTPQFPRQFKYSIGAKMHDLVVDLLNSAASAYLIRDKETSISHLVQYQIKFETLKTLVRVAIERRWIMSTGRQAQIVELMDAIGKQCTAWKNSLIASMAAKE